MEISATFRKLPSTRAVNSQGIRKYATAPLILIKLKETKCIAMYGKTPEDKDELIEMFDEETDLLLWPWPGKWSTDVFQITKKDLEVHYE